MIQLPYDNFTKCVADWGQSDTDSSPTSNCSCCWNKVRSRSMHMASSVTIETVCLSTAVLLRNSTSRSRSVQCCVPADYDTTKWPFNDGDSKAVFPQPDDIHLNSFFVPSNYILNDHLSYTVCLYIMRIACLIVLIVLVFCCTLKKNFYWFCARSVWLVARTSVQCFRKLNM